VRTRDKRNGKVWRDFEFDFGKWRKEVKEGERKSRGKPRDAEKIDLFAMTKKHWEHS